MDELRFAIRRLTKRPGATLASVVTLACAIGAAAATWSLLSAVLLRPLPVSDPDRLMVVGERRIGPQVRRLYDGFTYPHYPLIREAGIFQDVVAYWGGATPSLLVGAGTSAVRKPVGFASHDFFTVLGVSIPVGRNFAKDDDRRGAPAVAILSDRYWRRTFGADPTVVGRMITVAGKPVTIVGVLTRGFRGVDLAQAPDLYLPLHTIADVASPLTNYFADTNHSSSPTAGVAIIGRLRSSSSSAEAVLRLSTLISPSNRGASREFGLTDINTSAIPAAARAGMRQFTTLLAATVGLLLLAGCVTVGTLLLIRTEARREELAMCLALGASRGRLARGIALEGAVLSSVGAIAALPLAWWLFSGLRAFRLPGGVDIGLLELAIDRRALAAAVFGSVAGTLLITLIAGVFGFSANIGDALRSRGGSTPRVTRRTRAALVAAQVAVALVLLTGAGLFARSLTAALRLNVGRDMGRIVTAHVQVGQFGDAPTRATAFFDDLLVRLQQNAAVESVAFSVSRGGMLGKLTIDGVPRQPPSQVYFDAVDDRFFPTMRIPVVQGRNFSADDREQSPRVAIVSESFARMFSNGRSPLGVRVMMPFSGIGRAADVMAVVGVVPDVVTNVAVLEPLAMYFPISQHTAGLSRTVTVRAAGSADAARREVLSTIKSIDPAVTPGPLMTLEETIARQMSAQRFGALVLGALGVIAVLLTVLGTYVLAESMAALRMREMGIRAALGATAVQLGAIVLAETARLVGLGLIVGLGLAWVGASTIRAFLFQIEPLDPPMLAVVAALILTLAIIVSLRPAWRVARVDLGRVLKEA